MSTVLRRGWLAPCHMQRLVGYLMNHFCIRRASLAVLRDVYTFIGDGKGGPNKLPDAVLDELRVCQGLLPTFMLILAAPR